MKTSNEYAKLGLAAMCRAAEQARKSAALLGLKIPVWRDGRVVYVDPGKPGKVQQSTKSGSRRI